MISGAARCEDIVWPTPNRAFAEGKSISDFVQPTVSGLPESGLFGCVRTSRRQFHEGIDLKPISRDRHGEPTDVVSAILSGVVRYVNDSAGSSNYGRYIVIEHTDERPTIISLYAHLASVASGIKAGARVAAGQPIGIMGHTATGTPIPKDRAHVHVETGLWLGRSFQRWYDAQKYSSRNEHGLFNGMNIAAFDFLDFMERRRAGEVHDFNDYLARLPVAAAVFVRSKATPDFVLRYPELLRAPMPADGVVAGWRIEFTWFGLPKGFWPLNASEAAARSGAEEIVFRDEAVLERFPCQTVVRLQRGHAIAGARMRDALDILFAAP
jgi:hypothetical protein